MTSVIGSCFCLFFYYVNQCESYKVHLCPVCGVQEVTGGGAAAEDIVSPSHPKPVP